MQFGISTRFYRQEPLTVDVLERLRKAKFQRIEIFGNRPHFDFHNRALVRSLARWFDENEAPAPSVHLPFEEPYSRERNIHLPLFAPEERQRQRALDELKRCMELAEFTRVDYAVLHLGYEGQSFNPVLLEHAYAAVATVQSFSGVRVLIENGLNDASTPDRILEFIAVAQLQNTGLCYDAGHGYLRDAPPPFEKIDAIQLNDNDGTGDGHWWPFSGLINWPAFIEGMMAANYSKTLLFETEGPNLSQNREVIDRFGELFDHAKDSIEEFRLRYKLPSPQTEE